MRISPSQIKTFRCPRKWALERIFGLGLPMGEALARGSIFHRVNEIWLSADDSGRDKYGRPVDPFTGKWWIWDGDNIFYALSEEEQELLKTLFSMAISKGVLQRLPGRELEKWISMPIIPGVDFIGKSDMLVPKLGEVHDHKTVKKKKYALSVDKLSQDWQMLEYAYYLLKRDPSLVQVLLRHNYFLWDFSKPDVFIRETFVQRPDIEEHWNTVVVSTAHDMMELKREVEKGKPWDEIPTNNGLCNEYGGCPFSHLCGGMEDFEACKRRLERMSKQILKKMEEQRMSIFDKMNKPEAEKPKKEAKEAQPQPQKQETPEWAQPDCKACEGTGYNSKGKPCRICQQVYRLKGRINIAPKKKESEEKKSAIAAKSTAKREPDIPMPDAAEQEGPGAVKEAFDSAGQPPKRRRGRPKKTETQAEAAPKKPQAVRYVKLFIDCVPTAGRKAVSLDEVLADIETALLEENREKFISMDFFARRDVIVDELRRLLDRHDDSLSAIYARTMTPLQQAAVALLRGRAKQVVEGLK